jgi:transaldolase
MTMPPKVAGEFLDLNTSEDEIIDRTEYQYTEGINKDVNTDAFRLNTLWAIDAKLISCVDELENENLDSFTPDDLFDFFKKHQCSDVLVQWDDSQIETSYKEGKIPCPANWKDALESKAIGLDSLMNLAGLSSFRSDQNAMDDHIKQLLDRDKK